MLIFFFLIAAVFFFKWKSIVKLRNLTRVYYIIYFSCLLVILMYFVSWTIGYYYCNVGLNKAMFYDTMCKCFYCWTWLKIIIKTETVYQFSRTPFPILVGSVERTEWGRVRKNRTKHLWYICEYITCCGLCSEVNFFPNLSHLINWKESNCTIAFFSS